MEFPPLLFVLPITGPPGCGGGNVGDTKNMLDKLLVQEGMDRNVHLRRCMVVGYPRIHLSVMMIPGWGFEHKDHRCCTRGAEALG